MPPPSPHEAPAPSSSPDPPIPEPYPGNPRFDRWAHRRGEPRVFAFLWTIYLMAATTMALASVGVRGRISVDVYRPVAQVLLVSVAAGIVIGWPLVRLSQVRPERGAAGAAMMDFFIAIMPVQAVVWPQAWLTGWPLDSIGALSVMLASWGMVVAGILAWGLDARTPGPDAPVGRAALWMGLLILLVAGGPVAGELLAGPDGPPAWAALASPLTAIHALTTGLPIGSLGHSVTDGQWSMMLIPGAAGAAAWLGAWTRDAWRGFRSARMAG